MKWPKLENVDKVDNCLEQEVKEKGNKIDQQINYIKKFGNFGKKNYNPEANQPNFFLTCFLILTG